MEEGREMPFTITGGNSNIPPGTYKAQLTGVQDGIPTEFGTARRWTWLVDVNGEGQELNDLTSENNGPKSKSFGYLEVLIGRKPVAGETIEDPTGKTVLLEIGEKNGWPKVSAVLPFAEPSQVEAGIPR
jgi:hypothetical protein